MAESPKAEEVTSVSTYIKLVRFQVFRKKFPPLPTSWPRRRLILPSGEERERCHRATPAVTDVGGTNAVKLLPDTLHSGAIVLFFTITTMGAKGIPPSTQKRRGWGGRGGG